MKPRLVSEGEAGLAVGTTEARSERPSLATREAAGRRCWRGWLVLDGEGTVGGTAGEIGPDLVLHHPDSNIKGNRCRRFLNDLRRGLMPVLVDAAEELG